MSVKRWGYLTYFSKGRVVFADQTPKGEFGLVVDGVKVGLQICVGEELMLLYFEDIFFSKNLYFEMVCIWCVCGTNWYVYGAN